MMNNFFRSFMVFYHYCGNIYHNLPNMPKTLCVNFRLFDFKTAIKLPILVRKGIILKGLNKNAFIINAPISQFMIKIGTGGLDGVAAERKAAVILSENSHVTFNGNTLICKGAGIRMGPDAELVFGNGFFANNNLSIICSQRIEFGDDIICGWNINIRDADGHPTKTDYIENVDKKPVRIGNHVWIGAFSDILKGVIIPDNSIIGYRSCVLKSFTEENTVIAGYPAKVVKNNTHWEH